MTRAPGGPPPDLSRNERLVLARLEASDRPLGAYDILKQVANDGIAAPNSVYRALRKLIAMGRVRKIASISAYVARRCDGGGEVGAYVICRRCGRAVEKSIAHETIATLLADASVTVDTVFIEAFGDCVSPACAKNG